MAKKTTKDPIRKLLADVPATLFLGNPSGTKAFMAERIEAAGGDLEEVLAWVREHGGYPDRTFTVARRSDGPSLRPNAPSKAFYVVPEDALN